MSDNPEVIRFENEDGSHRDYIPLSVRLPRFLEKYPPSEGYGVVVTVTDPLSLQPGLLRLYEAAIQVGKTPVEMGLPEVRSGNLVFRAVLIGPDGKERVSASAFRRVDFLKDYEIGETAARQRLVAACGFGGDVLDNDEELDIASMSLNEESAPPPAVSLPQATTPASLEVVPVGEEGAQSGIGLSMEPVVAMGDSNVPPPAPPVIKGAILAQLQRVAQQRGVPVPEVKTEREALDAIRDLQAA